VQYGAQRYTLRSLPVDEALRAVADAGFEGVELVGVDAVDHAAVDDLSVVAAHVGLADIEAEPARTLERCRANGTTTLVVPGLDGDAFADGSVDETAARLDRLAATVADAGGRLLYHNHEFEFGSASDTGAASDTERGVDPASDADPDPAPGAGTGTDAGPDPGPSHPARATAATTPFDRLVAATASLGFELDVGWAVAAGVDPISLLERYGDRIPLVHLKDVRVDPTAPRGGYPVDLGEGDVDLRGCLRAARDAGGEWAVFEHDAPADPVESTRAAASWLASEPSGPR
jgi:sugar phosphate isomerase/epimerase